MTEVKQQQQQRRRKRAISFGTGAAFGGFGSFALFSRIDRAPEWIGAGGMIAGSVAIVFLVIGLLVGTGAVFPRIGARILEVQDIDEVYEERGMLLASALSIFAYGAMVIAILFAAPGGAVPAWAAFGGAIATLAINGAVTLRYWDRWDEMWRQISWEGSALGLVLLFPALLLWAIAVHVGWLPAIDPLGVIALLLGSLLVGAFWAVGRRGLGDLS